jgi:hypothetical protein
MGSDKTAITIPGALEKLTFFTGTGRHRVQIIYFFRMQIGSRTPSGIGLGSGSRLRRMRWRLGLSRELWIEIFGKSWSRAPERKGPVLICIHRWKRPRMRCRRLPTSSTDPRRLPGDLRATNPQDSTDAPAHSGIVGTAAFLREVRCGVLGRRGDGVWRARERAHRVAESHASKGTRGHDNNAGRGSDRDLKK